MSILSILILIAIVVVAFIFLRKFRPPAVGDFMLFTGGVKCGKSTTSVYFAVHEVKRRRCITKVRNFFRRMFKKEPFPLPALYSNVPLSVPFGYVPIKPSLLLRQERFIYGSVIYLQEATLIADSMSYGVEDVDEALTLFCKLIGHETRGGKIYLDTQSVSDLHFAFKKCTNSYIHIFKLHKYWILPFIKVDYRQLMYSYDGNAVTNTFEQSSQNEFNSLFIWRKTWKYFDCYCYSQLTDDLPVVDKTVVPSTLKTSEIFSIKKLVKEEKHKRAKKVTTQNN